MDGKRNRNRNRNPNVGAYKRIQIRVDGALNRDTVIGVSYMFTIFVSLVLGSVYVQFGIICSLLCSRIFDTIVVEFNSM